MQKITLAAIGAAALLTLSGTAATAQETTPTCSKSVTDNCMQREGPAAAPHHAAASHHAAAKKHHAAPKHHAAKRHAAAKHHAAPKHKVAAKAAPAPAPAHKM